MPNIGPLEVAIICVIALIVLGPKRLPEAGRGLGRGIREFKDGITGAAAAESVLDPAEGKPDAHEHSA